MQKQYKLVPAALIALALVVGCTTTTIPVPEDGVRVVAASTLPPEMRGAAPPVVGQAYRPGDIISLAETESVTLQASDGRTWTLAGGVVPASDSEGSTWNYGTDFTLVKEPDDEDRKQENEAQSASNNALVATGIVAGSVVALAAALEATKGDSDPPPPLSP